MKYTIAIAALLGAITFEQTNAITVWSTSGQKIYQQDSPSDDDDSDSDDEEDQLAQLGDDNEVDHSNEFFVPGQHEMLGSGGYDRVTPPRFAADSDDIFMRSMIEQYALEQKTKEGFPSGKFWMDEASTRAAAAEVISTNCKDHLSGASKVAYMDTYFPKAWSHFDVNRSGKIEVVKMPQLMRFLCSDQYMYLW